jgi:RNA polymerase sigma factor (sigma-70 family)
MRAGASRRAIEQVYCRRGKDFFRFALAVTNDSEAARDAVQEGFARAIRSRSTFRGSGSLEGWLARCVLNAARDIASEPVGSPQDESVANGRVSELTLPDRELRAIVRDLPPRQREVLFLRFYLDYDYAAISETLGIEVGTVSATLHAAREQLARLLQEVTQ